MTTEGFAGLPYDLQPTTATRTSAHVPTVPDNVRYESLPPSLPHATYQASATTEGQVHPNSRLRDVQRVLRGYAKSARAAAHDVGDPDSRRAAALRGKASGYDEAADLIESVLRGGRARRKWLLRRG